MSRLTLLSLTLVLLTACLKSPAQFVKALRADGAQSAFAKRPFWQPT
jgi:hypothetical protein